MPRHLPRPAAGQEHRLARRPPPDARVRFAAPHRADRARQQRRPAARRLRPGDRGQQLRRRKRRRRGRVLLRGLDPRAAAVPARQRRDPASQRHARAAAWPTSRPPSASAPSARSWPRRPRAAADEQALARRRDEARRDVEFALMAERENGMALALVLLIAALGAGGAGVHAARARRPAQRRRSAGALAGARGRRRAARLDRCAPASTRSKSGSRTCCAPRWRPRTAARSPPPPQGALVCVLDPERSRVTGAAPEDLPFDWSPTTAASTAAPSTASPTARGRRVFVPGDEAVGLGQPLRPGDARIPHRALPARPRGDGPRPHRARRVRGARLRRRRRRPRAISARGRRRSSRCCPSGRTSGWSTAAATAAVDSPLRPRIPPAPPRLASPPTLC